MTYFVFIGMILGCTACKHKKRYVKAKREPKPVPVITAAFVRKLDFVSFSKGGGYDFRYPVFHLPFSLTTHVLMLFSGPVINTL